MSSAEFWDLTMYDVGGWVGRIQKLQERRREDQELHMELSRQWMALYTNFKIDHKKHPAVKPEEFFKLSYDKPEPEKKKISHKELMEKMSKVRKKKK